MKHTQLRTHRTQTGTQNISRADHKQYIKKPMTRLNVEKSVTRLTILR